MLYELLDADASPLWQGVGKWVEFLESAPGTAKTGEFYLNCGINHRLVEMNLYKVLTNMHCWIGKVIFLTNTCPFCWTRLQLWQSLSYMPPKQSASLALALHVSLPAKRPSVRRENITAKFILCGTTTTKQISKKEFFWSKKKTSSGVYMVRVLQIPRLWNITGFPRWLENWMGKPETIQRILTDEIMFETI